VIFLGQNIPKDFLKKMCNLQGIKVHVCIISLQYFFSGTWKKSAKKQRNAKKGINGRTNAQKVAIQCVGYV
jgi:hypothetical protein